ncbi:MAG: amidohydrolase [Acidimicrobiales bacterium]|nr:amidohydrolase [Acidimicrobiales bacterium]
MTVMEYREHSAEMTYSSFDHPVFDCDFHFYEGADAFTRYLPDEYAGLVRLANVDGRTKMIVKGRISNYIPNPTFEVVAEPGSAAEYFTGRNTEGKSYREIVRPMRAIPAFFDRDARLELMDRMHVDSIVNFPTLASLIEVNFMDDPEATQALIRAFNRWMLDEWGFEYAGRIYSTPIMNLSIVDEAVAELEWALDHGARTVLVRPGPVAGHRGPRSPFLADTDPFWARVQEAGIPVMLHASDSGYQRYANEWSGNHGEMRPFEQDPFMAMSQAHRPIMDTVMSAVAHGMLSRFPGVRLGSIENGGRWITRVVEDLSDAYGKMPQLFDEHPLDVLKRALYIAPYWEDPIEPLIDAIGLDHVLFNSDWPHPEGLADPVEYAVYARDVVGLGEDDLARVMGGNMTQLLGG